MCRTSDRTLSRCCACTRTRKSPTSRRSPCVDGSVAPPPYNTLFFSGTCGAAGARSDQSGAAHVRRPSEQPAKAREAQPRPARVSSPIYHAWQLHTPRLAAPYDMLGSSVQHAWQLHAQWQVLLSPWRYSAQSGVALSARISGVPWTRW